MNRTLWWLLVIFGVAYAYNWRRQQFHAVTSGQGRPASDPVCSDAYDYGAEQSIEE